MAETNQNQGSNQQTQQGQGGQPSGQASQQTQQTAPVIDYDKIQQMLNGTLAAKEDTALKAYFKQQGLSEDEMKQAIAAFKQQKAASQPDVGALQGQLTDAQAQVAAAQAEAQKARLESAAAMTAMSLSIDSKTIPYVLKMADLSGAMDKEGKVNEEALKTALNKVLEDVPALKPQTGGGAGFTQIGTAGNPSQQTQQTNQNNQRPVATKRWNRFNS